jgi:nicotinamidase/pyrazinamidase
MARVIFWDVDTQYDFMRAAGRLYVPEAEAIIPSLQGLTDYAHRHGIPIVASADAHAASDPEISDAPDWKTTFPPHCLRGSSGARKIPETALRNPLVIGPARVRTMALADRVRQHGGDILFLKQRFDVFTNDNVLTVLDVLAPQDVVLYGVALDVCVKAAIEGLLARRSRTRLFAVTDAMKPIDRDGAEHLLREWGEEGVRLVSTREIVDEGLVADLARASA